MNYTKEQLKKLKEIDKERAKEKKMHEKHLKDLEKASSKRSPKEKAHYDYVDKMNSLGHGSTKKEVEEARKHMDKYKG